MRKQSTYCPELPLFVENKQITRPTRNERSRDSEGRYAIDAEIPDKAIFLKIEQRRQESLSKMLRIKDEEIIRLKEEIKQLKKL